MLYLFLNMHHSLCSQLFLCVCFQRGTFVNDSFFIVFVVKPNDFDCSLVDTISHVQHGE